ncbi:MAG: hypothetical protein AAGA30_13710, partial [Planctomycetota bacterium]
MINLLRITVLFAAGFWGQMAAADFLDYTFTGVIPDGASQHAMVADGETWTATMRIDTTVEDVNPNPNVGLYETAVLFGTLEFSGGYETTTIDFSGATVFVLNDIFEADSIRVRGASGLFNFTFQANNEDLSTLSDELLPEAGTTIDPFPGVGTFEYFQLTFDDELGFINYFANTANNVSFSANTA